MHIAVLLLLIFAPNHIHSWDIAVAGDEGLSLLHINGTTEENIRVGSLSELYALAFDPIFNRFFISVTNQNDSIYVYDITTNESIPIVPKVNHDVQGIALDPDTQLLYWTDGNGHNIWKRSVRSLEAESEIEVFLNLPEQIPMGIAVSSCHRGIFWANNNNNNASVNRVDIDGTKHIQIVTEDLFQPLGLTIDEAYGKIYWTDDRAGIYYRIERCGLDGSDRELVMQHTHQEPFGVAITYSTIFWTDTIGMKVWTLSTDMTFPNHTNARLKPDLFYDCNNNKPVGIAVRRNVTVSCAPVKILRPGDIGDVFRPVFQTTPSNLETVDFCLNQGDLELGACRCRRGYSGRYCEISLCHNHCLHKGSCHIDSQGYPDCQCLPGYEGRRCERDVCDDYCLSGGRCYVESGQAVCKCPDGTNGQRCEVSAKLTVTPLSYDVPILAGLGAIAGTLLVIVFALAWRVIILRRRPRVKKRYIVNKGKRSQTPLTSRPPSSPVEQCEITIENCCNMNICETPCFEPNLRTTKTSSHKKTEDRRQLLKNMEVEPGGSD